MTRVLLIIGLLVMLVGCGALFGLVNAAGRDAVRDALNDAPAGQHALAVCVGLNIGSCRVARSSSSTARPAGDEDGAAWPMLACRLR